MGGRETTSQNGRVGTHAISFISKAWGGRASNHHITENSKFLKYVVCNDVIMADRGFNIAKTLGTLTAKLEIPSFTKGQDQMRAEDVEVGHTCNSKC